MLKNKIQLLPQTIRVSSTASARLYPRGATLVVKSHRSLFSLPLWYHFKEMYSMPKLHFSEYPTQILLVCYVCLKRIRDKWWALGRNPHTCCFLTCWQKERNRQSRGRHLGTGFLLLLLCVTRLRIHERAGLAPYDRQRAEGQTDRPVPPCWGAAWGYQFRPEFLRTADYLPPAINLRRHRLPSSRYLSTHGKRRGLELSGVEGATAKSGFPSSLPHLPADQGKWLTKPFLMSVCSSWRVLRDILRIN